MVKVDLQTVRSILYFVTHKSTTYGPGYFALDSSELSFGPYAEEWFEARCVEGPLEVEILYMKVEELAPLNALDSEVEPGPERYQIRCKPTYLNPVYL